MVRQKHQTIKLHNRRWKEIRKKERWKGT